MVIAIRHGWSIELGRLKIDKDLFFTAAQKETSEIQFCFIIRFIRVQFESCLLYKNKEVLPSASVYTNKNIIFKKGLYKVMELIGL